MPLDIYFYKTTTFHIGNCTGKTRNSKAEGKVYSVARTAGKLNVRTEKTTSANGQAKSERLRKGLEELLKDDRVCRHKTGLWGMRIHLS